MHPHHASQEELLRTYASDPAKGLTAQQVEEARARYGENRLAEKKKKSNLQRFFAQFKDVMILILLAAAAVSFGVACVEGDPSEFFEPVLILLIVVLNAILGTLQESKAEKALDALKSLSAPGPGSFGTDGSRSSTPRSWCPGISSTWRPATLSPRTPACW